jgi:hypothetical protein
MVVVAAYVGIAVVFSCAEVSAFESDVTSRTIQGSLSSQGELHAGSVGAMRLSRQTSIRVGTPCVFSAL